MRTKRLIIMAVVGLALAAMANAAEYILQPGDTLNIVTLNEPNLSGKVTINPDGKIILPLTGEIPAAGRSLSQFVKEFGQVVARYVVEPKVTVELVAMRRRVAVLGEVRSPGAHDLGEGARLVDLIVVAGGFTAKADLTKISIAHSDGKVETVNLQPAEGDEGARAAAVNPPLSPGDVVLVPARPERTRAFSILGEVSRPGIYSLRPDQPLRLLEALTLAGGLGPRADGSKAMLARVDGSKRTLDLERLLRQGDGENLELSEGDFIFVPEKSREQYGFYVLGGVARPGLFPMEGKVTALEAVALAGGLKEGAKASEAYLLRGGPLGTKVAVNLRKVIRQADLSSNLELQAGDVLVVPEAKRREYNWQRAWIVRDLLWIFLR